MGFRLGWLLGSAFLWAAASHDAVAQFAVGSAARSEPLVVTPDMMAGAAATHPQAFAAGADVDAAVATRFRADAAYIPQASLRARFSFLPAMRGTTFNGYRDSSEYGPFLDANLDFGMPLIAFGQLFALRDLGDAAVDAAEAQRSMAMDALRVDAIALYARWVEAHRRRRTIEASEVVLTQIEARLDEMYEDFHPDYDPVDALKLRVRRADWEQQRLDAVRAESVAVEGVRAFLRVPMGAPLALPADVGEERVGAARSFHPLGELDTYAELALRLRPEVQLAAAAFEAAEANVLWRTTQFLPGIGLVGQASFRYAPHTDNQRGVFTRNPYTSLGGGAAIGLRWTLDLSERVGTLQEAFAMRRAARSIYDAWRFKLRADLAGAHAEVVRQRDRVNTLTDARQAADQWFEVAESRYGAGDGRLDGILKAWTERMGVTTKLEGAWRDYHRAMAELHRTAGLEPTY